MLAQAERIIAALPDVATYARRTGTQLGFFVTEPNTGDIVIRLKPRGRRRDVEEVIDDLRARIAAAEPALRTDFGQALEDAIGDLTGGEPHPIDVRIYGEDQTVLQQKAKAAAKVLDGIRGVEDVFDGITIAGPNLTVAARPDALARFGLTAESLHAEVQPALTGTVAGAMRLGERLYDIRVFSRSRPDLSTLSELPIPSPAGGLIPLSTLATISAGAPEAEIQRENLRTFVGVTARLAGRSLGSAIEEIRSRLAGLPGASLRNVHPLRGPVRAAAELVQGAAGCALRRSAPRRRDSALRVRRLAGAPPHDPGGAGRSHERARLPAPDGNDAERLELRRRDHDGRDRRRESGLPDPGRAGGAAPRRARRRSLGGGLAQAVCAP